MCEISKYPNLYFKATGILREEGINPLVPGFELLKRALVIYKIDGFGPNFLKKVKEGLVVPENEIKSEKRGPEEQWMVEAIKTQDIDVPLMEYIDNLAKRL